MYFSPVILSHHMLKSKLNESCSSIISHDTTIVFQDYREYVYIGIEKDCIGGKEKLRRELSFLRNTIGFLLGPCGHNELKTPEVDSKQRAWQSVTTILQQYISLCNTENSFILEALEKVRVNTEVKDVCSTVIQKSMKSFDTSASLSNVQYGLVFVGTKILSMQASSKARYNLSTENILQIITLTSLNSGRQDDFLEDETEESESEFSKSSIHGSGSLSISSTDDEEDSFDRDNSQDRSSNQSSSLSTDDQNQGKLDELVSSGLNQYQHSDDAASSVSNDSLPVVSNHFMKQGSEVTSALDLRNHCVPVYLATMDSPFIPHTLYCVPVSSQVNVVFVSKVSHSEISDLICGMLVLLRKLKFFDRKLEIIGGQATVTNLEKCNKKLAQKSKELRQRVRKRVIRLTESWTTDGQRHLNMFVNSGADEYIKLLETCVNETTVALRVLFKTLFPSFLTAAPVQQHTAALHKIHKFAKLELTGYAEYLHVKSARNIPIIPYLSRYPGLVYFTLVLRNRELTGSQDDLYCPSFNEFLNGASNEICTELKNQFQSGVYLSESNISDCGKLFTQIERGDFTFTSKTWFAPVNDYKRSYNTDGDLLTGSNHSASVFSGPFYRNFLSRARDAVPGSFTVLHLVSIHFVLVPKEVVAKQRDQLFREIIDGAVLTE